MIGSNPVQRLIRKIIKYGLPIIAESFKPVIVSGKIEVNKQRGKHHYDRSTKVLEIGQGQTESVVTEVIEMDSCPVVTPCDSCVAKTIDANCRTCTKTVTNHQCLQHVIDDNDTQRKTYGELLKDLLQVDKNLEDRLPQQICKECANLLKHVYKFILKARKRHEEFLQYDIKSEDCSQDMPIHQPAIEKMHIKIEPEEIRSEILNVPIKTEPVMTETPYPILMEVSPKTELEAFENRKEQVGSPLKCELRLGDDIKTEECVESDFSGSDTSEPEDDINEDFNSSEMPLPVRCGICDKVHMRTQAGERPFKCDFCEKAFRCLDSLKYHLVTHNDEKPYNCSECDKSYEHKDKLLVHMRIHFADKPFKCEACEKTFRSLHSLKYHLVTHSEEKPYICSQCGKSFKHKDRLGAHVRLHSLEKPFKCDICEKAFKRSSSLKYHLKTHSDEKPYSCSECGKSFKHKDNLDVHMRVHSGLRPYKCNECQKTFKYASGLKDHIFLHTGQKPFTCKTCDKSFARKTNLKAHCERNKHEN
uniref:Protein krueppel n=1 Tax=Glossina austeni TaxID=7395 RepID=A0A1A9VNX5_GLOAU